jgi:hypothetical protein
VGECKPLGRGGGGWAVRLETDSLSGAAAEKCAARSLRGLADVLASHLAAVSPAAVGGGSGSGNLEVGIRGLYSSTFKLNLSRF